MDMVEAMSGCNIGIYTNPDSLYVGIGTTVPNYTLDVSGNVNITGSVKATNMNMFRNKVINGDMRLDSQNNGGIVGVSGTAAMNTTSTDKWAVATGQYSPSVVAQQVALSSSDQATTGHTYAVSVSPMNQPFGLSAYFPFEGNLKDASGNGVVLAPTGTMLYVPGRVGSQCVYLANEGNVVSTATRAANYAECSFGNLTTLSMSCWFYATKAPFSGQSSCMMVYGNNASGLAFLGLNYSSTTNAIIFAGLYGITAPTSTSLPINTWYHIAGIYTPTSVSLYVNGSLIGTNTGTAVVQTSTSLRIGDTTHNSLYNPFAGYIDEARFYTRVLTQAEITALAAMTPFQPTLPASGLTSYYPLDGTYTDTVAANNLTATGTPVFQAGGVVGSSCVYFPNEAAVGTATPASHYATRTIPALTTSGPVSYSLWLNTTKINVAATPLPIMLATTTDATARLFIENTGNTSTYRAAMNNGTTYYYSPNTTLSINTWYFMTVVWASNSISFYVNGVFIGSTTTTGTLPANTSYLSVGSGGGAYNAWSGYIDDLRIYNGTALTPSQIAAIYYSTNAAYANFQQTIDAGTLADFQWGTAAAMPATLTAWLKNNTAVAQAFSLTLNSTGLIGYLPFDNSYADAAGAGFLSAPVATTAATFSNSVFKVGTYALNLTANTAGGTGTAFVDYNIANGLLPLSFSLWVNPTTLSGYSTILHTYTGTSRAFNIICFNAGLYIDVYIDGTNYSTGSGNGYTLNTGVWSHISLILQSGSIILYVNGIQVRLLSISTAPTYLTSASSPVIKLRAGAYYDASSAFKGYMDDVRIYNRALTAAQVKALYDANASSTTAPSAATLTLPVRNVTYNTPSIPANAWQQVQLTIPADSTGAWETRPGQPAATLALCLGAGSAYSNVSTETWTNNTEYIGGTTQLINNSATGFLTASSNAVLMTGVQLEKGALATGYEIRPVGIESVLAELKTPHCRILGATCGGTSSDAVLLTGNPVTYYLLKYQTVLNNNFNLYDTVNKRIVAPTNGLYYIQATAPFTSGGGTTYTIYIIKNADYGNSTTNGTNILNSTVATSMANGVGYATVQCSVVIPLNTNDYINVYIAYEQATVGSAYFRMGTYTTFTWANPLLNAYFITAI